MPRSAGMRRKNCSCVCPVKEASITDGFALRTSAIHGGRESGRLCGENYYFEAS